MPLPSYPSIDPAFAAPINGYTPGIGFTVKWTPIFQNLTQIAQSGAAIQVGLSPYPLHQFELNYELLRDLPGVSLEFRRVLAFFGAMNGSLGRFGFTWPEDNAVTGQQLAPGDGSTTVFTLVRTFGDAAFGNTMTEPVGVLKTIGNILVNGSPASVTTGGGVPGNNTIQFASPPPLNAVITCDITYGYYCRFADDSVPFEKFSNGRWQAGSVKLISCRAGT
jgi:uncharacterized protein (TIGR02217 family)